MPVHSPKPDTLGSFLSDAPRPPKPARTARISSAYQLRAALVRSALQTHGPATVRDLATRTGLTTDQLGTTLARMRHMGDVRVVDVQTARKAYGRDVLQVYGLA